MDPVVRTRSGAVRGVLEDGVNVFKGIPYAAPPFGGGRLRPPQPREPWTGELDATRYGATVPHAPYPAPFDRILAEPFIEGEDCLNLNVWTPDIGAARLPVMFWIHGGAFTNGSGAIPTYDGTGFARSGVVLVTFNYRLGIDGFALLPGGVPNLGLRDQVAALHWVRENISAFGGDPDRVTIFGESAGGMSVATLLAVPAARGLFRAAAAQSGAASSALSLEQAEAVGADIVDRLGVRPSAEAVAEVPLERLYAAQLELRTEARAGRLRVAGTSLRLPFAPVVDGDVLPERPLDAVRSGRAADVPLLVATNLDEQRLWLVPTGAIDAVDEAALQRAAATCGLPPAGLEVYRRSRPGASPGEVLAAVTTDASFRLPAIHLAEAQAAAGEAAWMYEFAWTSPLFEGRLGACHALEIAFVFDNLARGRFAAGDAPQELATRMHSHWVRLATTGDPGWPRYDPARRMTMRFGPSVEVVDDPRRDERESWRAEVAAARPA